VILSPRGPVVIDWNNAHIGNPIEDVARSKIILAGAAVTEPAARPSIDRFTEAYLKRYFQLRPDDRQQLAAWQPIVAAVRLADNIPGLQEWLLAQIRAGLAWHYKKYEDEQSIADRVKYSDAEREARMARRGLWRDANPMSPWDYRKGESKQKKAMEPFIIGPESTDKRY